MSQSEFESILMRGHVGAARILNGATHVAKSAHWSYADRSHTYFVHIMHNTLLRTVLAPTNKAKQLTIEPSLHSHEFIYDNLILYLHCVSLGLNVVARTPRVADAASSIISEFRFRSRLGKSSVRRQQETPAPRSGQL